ncbi:hypothetical protein BT93_A1117 [Corymbia citriodora subsp. variegata]|nr:hypothetical protein BT93_A1117 [Corymbia citriodora subsp. variegata]
MKRKNLSLSLSLSLSFVCAMCCFHGAVNECESGADGTSGATLYKSTCVRDFRSNELPSKGWRRHLD